jgi:hypothetical protein
MKQELLISEIISDDYFKLRVKSIIDQIKNSRRKRPTFRAAGMHYKRDWYDRMVDDRQLSHHYFIDSIEEIWLHKSLLSSNIRNVIESVCVQALKETLQKREEERLKAEVDESDSFSGITT